MRDCYLCGEEFADGDLKVCDECGQAVCGGCWPSHREEHLCPD